MILTADTGSGHRTNVNAIKRVLAPLSLEVEVCAGTDGDAALRYLPKAYRWLNLHAPKVFALYFASRRSRLGFWLNRTLARWRLRPTLDAINVSRANVVVIAHSIYCHAIDYLTATGARVVVLVVDLSGGPLEWFQPGADLYVVQSDAARLLALKGGVPAESILVRRVLPPSADVGAALLPRPVDSGQAHRVRRLLILGGGDGVGPILKAVLAIQGVRPDLEIAVVCGMNRVLAKELRALAKSIASVEEYVPNVAERFPDFDLVITKPGSVTLIELLYADVPFVLMRGIPGVEAANEKLLSREAGLPVIFDGRSAAEMIEHLLDPDLRLTSAGASAFEALRRFARELPDEFLGADETLGTKLAPA